MRNQFTIISPRSFLDLDQTLKNLYLTFEYQALFIFKKRDMISSKELVM